MRRAVPASRTGMSIFVSGWRTLMFTLRRRASTIDETCWAIDIICSNSPSMSEESQTGKVAKMYRLVAVRTAYGIQIA